MGGKFDGHGPYSIVREVQELKRKVQRASSVAKNAAALARAAVPIMETFTADWDGTLNSTAYKDILSVKIAVPSGVRTAYVNGYSSTGASFNSASGGSPGTFLYIVLHGDQDWSFQIAPAIANGTPGASACSASTYGAGTFRGWLQDYGVTSIELKAQSAIVGASSAGNDNAHMAGSVMFYRA